MEIKTVSEREERLNKLSSSQREFLTNLINNKKRHVFTKSISSQKGTLSDKLSLDEAEKQVAEWELVEVIDSGFVNEKTRCECGRPLRYQYIVQHKKTKKVLKFGLNHFEEHMGLAVNVVEDIRKKFMEIDNELDELLEKIENQVNHQNLLSNWPDDCPIPEDIKEQLDHNIPLLDKQIQKLQNVKNEYFSKKQDVIEEAKKQASLFASNEEFNLFTMDVVEETSNLELDISNDSSQLEEIVYQLVKNGIYGVMELCEILIDEFGVETEWYKTGRPKIIVNVISILEKYVEDGKIFVTEDSNIQNRYYIPIKK